MIRIAGKNISDKKQVRFALTPIKGIGKSNVKKLLAMLNIDPTVKLSTFSDEQLTKLRNTIDEEFVIETDLRRQQQAHIKHLIDIKTYRGDRHHKHLPVHGQTTKTNSRTARGKKAAANPSIKTTKKTK